MEPFFSEEQLNNMSRENLIELMKIMKVQTEKKDMEIQLLKDKQKELEFMNALLSDRLTLAQRRQFGSSSEKYAEGYELFHYYMRALIDKRDRKLAASLLDTGHFEKGVPAEKKEQFDNIVRITESCQDTILTWCDSIEQAGEKGEIEDYAIGYQVSTIDEYVDEDGAKWTDIYIELKAQYKQLGSVDTSGEFYRISVKEYEKGWRIARISES